MGVFELILEGIVDEFELGRTVDEDEDLSVDVDVIEEVKEEDASNVRLELLNLVLLGRFDVTVRDTDEVGTTGPVKTGIAGAGGAGGGGASCRFSAGVSLVWNRSAKSGNLSLILCRSKYVSRNAMK